jgi:transcriptional regulator with GAF, ATPase, and Fis domain
VDLDATLVELARLLLSADDEDKTAEVLLGRVLELTGAERGFIVVRQDESYVQKLNIGFDRSRLSRAQRAFSRSIVRGAIESRQLVYSPDVLSDPRFAELESVQDLGCASVLAAPLHHADEVYGVIYLERRGRPADFDPDAHRFLSAFSELAGLFLLRALERQALRERNLSLEHDLLAQHDFAGILTRDSKMLGLLRTVAQVAGSGATVLILGETGTGKELVARALHLNGPRRRKPFVPVHCTALPGTLLESELFGHTRGAFTGAERERSGRIASAEGGTLFLDEIAEIPLELQSKLLRFLQFGELQRLGSDRVEKVDVRVVAATHQDLQALIRTGRFRQDLYFRLNLLELSLPPLREREGDVPLLAEHFLRKYWTRSGPEPRWTRPAWRLLEGHAYPGNVRELEHIVERACLLATGPELDAELLPSALRAAAATPAASRFGTFNREELAEARETALAEVERSYVLGLLERCEGNVSRAARESGFPRSHIQRMLARHRSASAPRPPA